MVQRHHRLPGLEQTVAEAPREPRDVIVTIEGLSPLAGEPNTFRLEGVTPVEIDPRVVGEALEKAGIPRSRAMRYTDELLENIHRQELAHLIAERMSQIG